MATIYDIKQPRNLIRCSSTEWQFIPEFNTIYGTASVLNNAALYFGTTNHQLNHTGEMIVRIKSPAPDTTFGLGQITFYVGFIVNPANACVITSANLDSGIFYGCDGFDRFAGNDWRAGFRQGGPLNSCSLFGIVDADFANGILLKVVVTNRFVFFYYGKTVLQPFTQGTFPLPQGTFIETPTGYINTGNGNLPPVSSKFRWTGSRARVFETLIPVFAIKQNLTIDILSVNQGETPSLNVPVQP